LKETGGEKPPHPRSGERHPQTPSDDIPSSPNDVLFGEYNAMRPSNDAKGREGHPEGGARRSKETSRGSSISPSDCSKRREWNRKEEEYDAENSSGLAPDPLR